MMGAEPGASGGVHPGSASSGPFRDRIPGVGMTGSDVLGRKPTYRKGSLLRH